MKQIVLCCVVLCALVSLASSSTPLNVQYTNTNLQYVGRNNLASATTGAVFGWSGTSVNFQMKGASTFSAYFSADHTPLFIDLIIDGGEKTMVAINSTKEVEYILATGLSTTVVHTIVLAKATEAAQGALHFFGLGIPSGGALVSPTARPPRRIEFIGDSITCGFGDLGVNPCGYTPATQDVWQSHGPTTARYLDADYMITAWSGLGMVRNVGAPNTTSPNPLPYYYTQAVGGDTQYGSWNFHSWVPQAVLINLGTNDYSSQPSPPSTLYINAYVQFINSVKSNYSSNPHFFIACGPMINTYCPYLTTIASETGATVIDLTHITQTSLGCAGHPTVATHQQMAMIEAQAISKVLGWAYDGPTPAPTLTPCPASGSFINSGQSLVSGSSLSYLKSTDCRFTFAMQGDGNIVLYDNGVAKWNTATFPTASPFRLAMQGDGNLVAYDNTGHPYWDSATNGKGVGPYKLTLSTTGNVALTDSTNAILWQTNTTGAK